MSYGIPIDTLNGGNMNFNGFFATALPFNPQTILSILDI